MDILDMIDTYPKAILNYQEKLISDTFHGFDEFSIELFSEISDIDVELGIIFAISYSCISSEFIDDGRTLDDTTICIDEHEEDVPLFGCKIYFGSISGDRVSLEIDLEIASADNVRDLTTFDEGTDTHHEFCQFKRFDQIVICTLIKSRCFVIQLSFGSGHDDGGLFFLPDLLEDSKSIPGSMTSSIRQS